MYSIRSFVSSDAENLKAYFDRFFPQYPVSEESIIRRVLLDPNFDPDGFFFLMKDGAECGMAYAVIRLVPVSYGAPMNEDTGYIPLFCIPNPEDVQNAGKLLLETVENWLSSKGRTKITTSYMGTRYFTVGPIEDSQPEIAALYTECGYSRSEHIAMDIDLSRYEIPAALLERKEKLAREGIYIGPLRKSDILSLLTPSSSNPPGWVHHSRYRLQQAPLDLSRFTIASNGERVIGTAVFGDPNSSPTRFGPYRVSEEYRGRGIGAVILAVTLREMRSRGFHNAWFQSTNPHSTAYSIYTRAGFRVTMNTPIFEKSIGD